MSKHTPTADAPEMTAIGDDDQCAERLAPMWNAADMHSHYPAMTADVVELLRSGAGCDVSADLLEGWCRSGMVPGCRLRSGQFAWMPTNIVTALIQAETWRRWVPLDPRNLHKWTSVEIAEHLAHADGATIFKDGHVFDVTSFIEILVKCDDRDMRRTVATALKTKLATIAPGVLDK